MDVFERKRTNYLGFFKEGVFDALFNQELYEQKKSSAYYKLGYQFGAFLLEKLKEKELENER